MFERVWNTVVMVVVVVVIDSFQEIWELLGVVDPFCLRRFERYYSSIDSVPPRF